MKIAIKFHNNGLKEALKNTLRLRIGVSVTIKSYEDFLDFVGEPWPKESAPKIYPLHLTSGTYSRAIIWKRYTVKEWKNGVEKKLDNRCHRREKLYTVLRTFFRTVYGKLILSLLGVFLVFAFWASLYLLFDAYVWTAPVSIALMVLVFSYLIITEIQKCKKI